MRPTRQLPTALVLVLSWVATPLAADTVECPAVFGQWGEEALAPGWVAADLQELRCAGHEDATVLSIENRSKKKAKKLKLRAVVELDEGKDKLARLSFHLVDTDGRRLRTCDLLLELDEGERNWDTCQFTVETPAQAAGLVFEVRGLELD